MASHQYVALLRGINVGGKNIIKMADLKVCFENAGFGDVVTFIQSGNVLFATDELNAPKLTTKVEKALSAAFHYESRVVIRSHKQMQDTVRNAPRGFGQSDAYRYNVIFLKEPLKAGEALSAVSTKEGVDEATGKDGALYFATLKSAAASSHLPRLVGTPIYRNMTIRNWNTTAKLLALMDARAKTV
jgi:uncharacterized protein (DUF1697 family)